MAKIKSKSKTKLKPKTKKVIKRKSAVVRKKDGKLIGKITHYFSNIKVAVIKLSAPVKIRDTIKIVGGQKTDFEQKITSMQIDYKEVKSAKKGSSIGLKVDEQVRDGYKAYKI